ncbi:cutinase family protein, partial [Mycobacterium marseillense]
PTYADKTLKVCAIEDPVCSDGMNFAAHNTYADDGSIIDKGVAFASSHLGMGGAAPAPPPAGGGFGG